jgi:hypothetical protein
MRFRNAEYCETNLIFHFNPPRGIYVPHPPIPNPEWERETTKRVGYLKLDAESATIVVPESV